MEDGGEPGGKREGEPRRRETERKCVKTAVEEENVKQSKPVQSWMDTKPDEKQLQMQVKKKRHGSSNYDMKTEREITDL